MRTSVITLLLNLLPIAIVFVLLLFMIKKRQAAGPVAPVARQPLTPQKRITLGICFLGIFAGLSYLQSFRNGKFQTGQFVTNCIIFASVAVLTGISSRIRNRK